MLTFLGYTLGISIIIFSLALAIALGIYTFKTGIPTAITYVKDRVTHSKRESIDIEIEEKRQEIDWLKEKRDKILLLNELEEEEKMLIESIKLKKEFPELEEENTGWGNSGGWWR